MSNTIKYKLDDFAEAEESILIGIISSAPDYTVCWHINKQLNINLCRSQDIKIPLITKTKKVSVEDLFSKQEEKQIEETNFSLHHIFKFFDEYIFSDYYFIVNKGTLLNIEPRLKRVNYFLEIRGKNAENVDQLIFDLNAIEPIEMAYLIGKESIINTHQLLV